jgi:hypothetical protein
MLGLMRIVVVRLRPLGGLVLKFMTREQCEQFQIMCFGISCATCERSDQECPWNRDDAKAMTSATELEEASTIIAA